MHVCAAQVSKSPFVERLLKKGYEVLYLTEPVDEYCIQSLPEFEGKKFQNVAKEGLKLDQSEKAKEYKEKLEKEFEPLLKWLTETALKDKVGGGPGWVEVENKVALQKEEGNDFLTYSWSKNQFSCSLCCGCLYHWCSPTTVAVCTHWCSPTTTATGEGTGTSLSG